MPVPTDAVLDRARGITLLCLDVDGILTDGRLYYFSDGREAKAFNIRDGLGLKMLMAAGVKTAIITGRESVSARNRAKELGLDYYFEGAGDKLTVLTGLLKTLSMDMTSVAYMGDDLPDLACMKRCGLALTVPEADTTVRRQAHFITQAPGGEGAVREAAELILHAKNALQAQIDRFAQ